MGQDLSSAATQLKVTDLSTDYITERETVHAVSHVSFDVREKQIVAAVGESGCGKSTLALSIIGLLPSPPAKISSGQIFFIGRELLTIPRGEAEKVRGTGIAMIFQEPLSSLNPVLKIKDQLGEAIKIRRSRKPRESRVRKVYSYKVDEPISESPYKRLLGVKSVGLTADYDLRAEMLGALKLVRIPDPDRILDRYPFELSGGMRQRVMIAMALSENPALLIADEPTTALDVTTQAQVLQLMKELVVKSNMSLLLITHDLGVAAQIADRILVMYAGEIVEDAPVYELFENPRHPYTKSLLACLPKGSKNDGKLGVIPGSVVDLRQKITCCPFVDRCAYAMDRCRKEHPILEGQDNRVACFLYAR